MSIQQVTTDFAGQIGVRPNISRIVCTDSLATITADNYLVPLIQQGYQFSNNDIVAVVYGSTPTTQFFSVSETAGVFTLKPMAGDVTLPVTANHIAIYANDAGELTDDAATAINGGNIQAGLSGTAGYLASFPATASKGSLQVKAVANTGDTVTTISNAAMGQASVVTIPDPAAATANFVVAPSALVNNNLVKASGTAGLIVDAGARLLAGTTPVFAGGGATNTFTIAGMSASSVGACVITTSTNVVSLIKAVPGTNSLSVVFSGDPGANTTLTYLYSTANLT